MWFRGADPRTGTGDPAPPGRHRPRPHLDAAALGRLLTIYSAPPSLPAWDAPS